MCGAFDRASHQLREKRNVQGKIAQAFFRGETAVINIDRVAHRLKGIKRYPHRQNDMDDRPVPRGLKRGQKGNEVGAKKIEVFKKSQDCQIGDDADLKIAFAHEGRVVMAAHLARAIVIDECGYKEKR